MPEILYSSYLQKIKGSAIKDSCVVCLEDFSDDSICRESICHHIFHRDCLDQWLTKHENCPYCRTEMSEKNLQEWLKKNELNLKEEQQHSTNRADENVELICNNNNLNW